MPTTTILPSANGGAISEGGFDGAPGNYTSLHSNDGFGSVYGISEQTYGVDKDIPMTPSAAIPLRAKFFGNMTLLNISGKRSTDGYDGTATLYKQSTMGSIATVASPATQDVMNSASTVAPVPAIVTPAVCNSDLLLRLHVDGDAFASGTGSFDAANMLAWTYVSFSVNWLIPSGGFVDLAGSLVGAALGLHEMAALARACLRVSGHLITPDEYVHAWREITSAKRTAYAFITVGA